MRADVAGARYRLQLMAIVESASSIREGCRLVGIHHSTSYDWVKRVNAAVAPEEAFMPKDVRRRIGPRRVKLESTVVAVALANPGLGPRQLRGLVAAIDPKVGSSSQVWRILKAHGLSRAPDRYRTMAIARGLAEPAAFPDREWRTDTPQHLDAEIPGDLVQFDCFQLGRVKEARIGNPKRPGVVWQYTAIDVASSYVWADIATTRHAPSKIHTTALVHRVAQDLAEWGWKLSTVTTDSGNEFRNQLFTDTVESLQAQHRRIRAGRPQSNGKVEQVQNTILQECWMPTFVGYTEPAITTARQDLTDYLNIYNNQRPHWGKWNQGKTPSQIITPNTTNMP